MTRKEQEPVVYVSALSYKRPEELSRLLSGLARLGVPDGYELRFLIVDNDPYGSARAQVMEMGPQLPGMVRYVVEPELGISTARNRALLEAIGGGGMLLCFLDDDELPDPDWLQELLRHWQETDAVLIGGPQRRTMPEVSLDWLERRIAESLIARRRWGNRFARVAAAGGRSVPIATSNWMCDLGFVRSHGMQFEESMRFSGGEDTAFYLAVRRHGGITSWCPTAIVYEPIARERLSFRYQWKRSHDQGVVMAGLQDKAAPVIWIEQLARFAAGLGLMILPVFGIASISMGIQLAASALGHLDYLRGDRSAHYGPDQSARSPDDAPTRVTETTE